MASVKICCYCGSKAESRDHIPSKSLLEKPYPLNLLTIASCIDCNKSFSLDEEYFLNVLVEISDNPNLLLKKQPGGNVYKARERSIGLRERIKQSFYQDEHGKVYFISENDRIKKVIEKIALGLYYHKYKKLCLLQHFNCLGFYPYNVEEIRPADIFFMTYSEKFRPKKWTIIQPNVFSYIIVRNWAKQLLMIFEIYNTAWCVIEIPYPAKQSKRNLKKRDCKNQLTLFEQIDIS